MSKRATLEALLARVLEGEGPDRELDAEIARMQLPPDADAVTRSRHGWSYRVFGPDGWDDEWLENKPYTASLDAALTLMPEGWRINLLSEWDNETLRAKGAWQAILMPIGKGDSIHAGMRTRCDHAATPPRALIAVCLKARMEAQPLSNP